MKKMTMNVDKLERGMIVTLKDNDNDYHGTLRCSTAKSQVFRVLGIKDGKINEAMIESINCSYKLWVDKDDVEIASLNEHDLLMNTCDNLYKYIDALDDKINAAQAIISEATGMINVAFKEIDKICGKRK